MLKIDEHLQHNCTKLGCYKSVKTKTVNLCGRTRPLSNPYEIWQGFGPLAGWEWRVLKKYQTPENEKGNEYARWFCAVKSPMTYGNYEYGDTYVKDIKNGYSQQL